MSVQTYSETVAWLFEQFPSYQNTGAGAYKPGLTQTTQLLTALNIENQSAKIIHVAGTNGKGSTCSYISSILTEKNEKVGLFTSPHIFDFRERIRINGILIDEASVVNFCQRVIDLKLDFEPSFFEVTFAMAMDHFNRNDCTYLVIETGMGGRLDATNVLESDISIITNIGLDHTQFLGDTLEAIAVEKAGIIKVEKTVVIGQTQEETEVVFMEIAAKNQSDIHFADQMETKFPSDLLLPKFQLSNLQTALVTLDILGISVDEETVRESLLHLLVNTGFFGRLTRLQEAPHILLDVSHNTDGTKATIEALMNFSFEKLHIIYGASQDKDVNEILSLIPKQALIYLSEFQNNRSLKLAQLTEIKAKDSRVQSVSSDVNKLLTSLQSSISTKDLILVTGSFFLLSDLDQTIINR